MGKRFYLFGASLLVLIFLGVFVPIKSKDNPNCRGNQRFDLILGQYNDYQTGYKSNEVLENATSLVCSAGTDRLYLL